MIWLPYVLRELPSLFISANLWSSGSLQLCQRREQIGGEPPPLALMLGLNDTSDIDIVDRTVTVAKTG